MKQIEIIISPEGGSRIVSSGFSGRSCLDATRKLEEALGQRLSQTLTPEYHEHTNNQTNNEQRQ
ncbi:hypothetical protein Pla110_13690 [Polystyrenella longa]|uniref:DUF2997 domain-containing protein n=1 Tax=Polystyrenella longa TaxID=2528007 RepID=A0A518CKA5_9PLAN|nr:DUF2997 domain-containing protein [Polystyrenella longa]QDU79658.1 hypothetical protein Pla110_13690 [Polystyrenella longa]